MRGWKKFTETREFSCNSMTFGDSVIDEPVSLTNFTFTVSYSREELDSFKFCRRIAFTASFCCPVLVVSANCHSKQLIANSRYRRSLKRFLKIDATGFHFSWNFQGNLATQRWQSSLSRETVKELSALLSSRAITKPITPRRGETLEQKESLSTL